MIPHRKFLIVLACVLQTAVLSSCYQSPEPLSKPGLVLDHTLLGVWDCSSDVKEEADQKSSEKIAMAIYQFDDFQYYIEWREGEDHVTRYRAFPSLIDKSILVNIQNMTESDKQWTFVRYHVDQTNRLSVGLVNKDAVSAKDANNSLEEIRKRVTEDGLYSPLVSCIRQKD